MARCSDEFRLHSSETSYDPIPSLVISPLSKGSYRQVLLASGVLRAELEFGEMALPTVIVRDRQIVLLSGFVKAYPEHGKAAAKVVIRDEEELKSSVQRDRDAVAFGYVAGIWVASA